MSGFEAMKVLEENGLVFSNIETGVKIKKDEPVLLVKGNRKIKDIVPIIVEYPIEELTIRGEGEGAVLRLYCDEDMQPCIGSRTHTGMSYGRWSMTTCSLKKIIVDNVKVICYPKVENFSLGGYGVNAVPEIVLLNGGELHCPEATGKRYLVSFPKIPTGSTKISGSCTYAIDNGVNRLIDFLSDEEKNLVAYIDTFYPDFSNHFKFGIDKGILKPIAYALERDIVHPFEYIVKVLKNCNCTYNYILQAGILIGMEPENIVPTEAMFEVYKCEFLMSKYFKPECEAELGKDFDMGVAVCAMMLNGDLSDEKVIDLYYEMIPAYYWSFSGTHRENVENFINYNKEKAQEYTKYLKDNNSITVYDIFTKVLDYDLKGNLDSKVYEWLQNTVSKYGYLLISKPTEIGTITRIKVSVINPEDKNECWELAKSLVRVYWNVKDFDDELYCPSVSAISANANDTYMEGMALWTNNLLYGDKVNTWQD